MNTFMQKHFGKDDSQAIVDVNNCVFCIGVKYFKSSI